MTNTEYVKANFNLERVKSQTMGGHQLTIFGDDLKKGSIIVHPANGDTYVVVRTPVECESISCEVKKIVNGKRMQKIYFQYAYVGLLVDGKPCKALD